MSAAERLNPTVAFLSGQASLVQNKPGLLDAPPASAKRIYSPETKKAQPIVHSATPQRYVSSDPFVYGQALITVHTVALTPYRSKIP